MRLAALAASLAVAPTAALAAEAAMRDGALPVGAGNPAAPWLALSSVAMVATLFAVHWLVTRGPRQ
jgi:hypothetical protein